MLLFGVASGIVSIINTVDMRRRQAALEQAIDILEAWSEGTSREMNDIRGDLLAFSEHNCRNAGTTQPSQTTYEVCIRQLKDGDE